jgi:hypothetical protein
MKKLELAQFSNGSNDYHKHLGLVCTDGVMYVAKEAGAYWLLDLVASYQSAKMKAEAFQVYALRLGKNNTARMTITDSNDNILAEQAIEYTDFPQDIDLWLVYDYECATLMLPSEY